MRAQERGTRTDGRNTTEDTVAERETRLHFLSCEADGAGKAQGLGAADGVKGALPWERDWEGGRGFPCGKDPLFRASSCHLKVSVDLAEEEAPVPC